MKSSKMLVAAAALGGLFAGTAARAAVIAPSSTSSQSQLVGVKAVNLDDKDKGKHDCKGQNACKGQGGCKAGDAGCKGKNTCKGHGGCKTNEEPTTKGSMLLAL